MKFFLRAALAAALLVLGLQASAQGVSNIYLAGASYNSGASPSVAGSALYAHQVNTTGTYAFTLVDALPSSSKPFTVTTNIGAGVAQKVATIAGQDVLVPTSAGISWTGTNTGWAWSTGAAVPIKFKPTSDGGAWYIMPSIRIVKSSVSGGSGYQPIVGLMFGWGK